MSDELTRQNIESLLAERHGYEARMVGADADIKTALNKRVAAVNVALRNLGYGEPKAQSAKTSKPAKPSPRKSAARTSKRAATKKG